MRPRVYITVLALIWLVICGLLLQWSVIMYKSVVYGISPASFIINTIIRFFAGVIAFIIGMILFNRRLERYADAILWVSLGLLVITLVFGKTFGGATRWINILGFSFQPSEFVKYALIIYMGKVFAYESNRRIYRVFWKLLFISSAIAVLVALQPNISTASVLLFSAIIILILWGAKPLQIITSFLLFLILAGVSYNTFPHVRDRINIFLGKEESGIRKAQVVQAKVALVSGGVFGRGPGKGLQKLGYLPSSDKDFAYSYISEEYGLFGFPAGGFWIILMIILITWNGLWASDKLALQDEYKSFVCFGFSVLYFIFSAVHILVNIGLLPPTGLTLPFVSYGGSSLVTNAFAIGYITRAIIEGYKGF